MTEACTLITANAGCGKTWTLANRCIGWLVARRRATGHSQPAGLVAATFTRKAAGEILQRVLDHLATGALDPASIDGFKEGLGIDPLPSSKEMSEVLGDVAASLHRLQLGTLDGLYHRIAATFAGEIGMPAGWTIGDEPTLNAMHARALDDLLDGCEQSTIETLVTEAEREILKSQVHDRLLPMVFGEAGSSGLRGTWRQTLLAAGNAGPWQTLDEMADDVIAPGARWHSDVELEAACLAIEAAPVARNEDGTDKKNWQSARIKLLDLVRTNQWSAVLSNKLLNAVAFGGTYYSAPSPPAMIEAMAPVIAHARAELVASLRSRMRSWRLVLHGLDLAAERRQREGGVYGFQDVADHLARANLLANADREWLQFRLDAELRDLALDEFQDTSDAQFAVIQPIIEEIIAGEGGHDLPRNMLVVADPKQSIYGWRGGTPSLLNVLRAMGGDRLHESTLGRSYRSGPAIINFINDVFGTLETNMAFQGETSPRIPTGTLERCGLPAADTDTDPVTRALANWHFDQHDTAHPKRPSAILAWRIEPDHDQDENPMALRVVEVVRQRAPLAGTIGILLPTNRDVADVVDALRAAGIDASQEGGGALADATVIHDVLALLRLAEHPGHREAAYDVSHSPLGPLVDLLPLETIDPSDRDGVLSRVSRGIRRRAIDEGLEGLLVSLAKDLEPHTDARDRQALRYCIDLAAAWRPSDLSRLNDFVYHVSTSSAGEPSGAAVRVMTMHSAKGLEFDEVILPVLDERLVRKGGGGGCVTWAPLPSEPPLVVLPQAAESVRMHAPLLEIAAQRQLELGLGDRLSLLYVSVTRARRVLNLLFHSSDDALDKKLTPGNIIRAALPDLDTAIRSGTEDDLGRTWVRAESGWTDDTVVPGPPPEPPGAARPILVETDPTESPEVVTPSARGGESLAEEFRVWDTRARRRGTLLHELFREVSWLEDGRPDDAAVEAAFARSALATGRPASPDEREEALQVFEAALDDEQIAERLRRSAYADHGVDTLEVLQEWPILEHLDGELVRGRIDRMVVGRCGEEIVFIEIIDFKSGRLEDDEAAAEAVEYYRSQVEFYLNSVLVHFGLDPSMVTGRLLFIEAGRDLPCTPCQTAPSSS